MAELDWEYVERIKREHDDYLARKARYTGSPYKSAVLPIHTSVDEEELAKVTKENEKLLQLVKDMYEDMCKVLEHTSKETPDYRRKFGYVQGIEHRIQEILDGK